MPVNACDKTNHEAFMEELRLISQICNDNDIDQITIGDDLNTDHSKVSSHNTMVLNSFLKKRVSYPCMYAQGL